MYLFSFMLVAEFQSIMIVIFIIPHQNIEMYSEQYLESDIYKQANIARY